MAETFSRRETVLADADKPKRPGVVLEVTSDGMYLVACATHTPPHHTYEDRPFVMAEKAGKRGFLFRKLGLDGDSYFYAGDVRVLSAEKLHRRGSVGLNLVPEEAAALLQRMLEDAEARRKR